MDFDEYYNADSKEKTAIMKNTILEAVKKVRTRGKFDYERFCQDLQKMTENEKEY